MSTITIELDDKQLANLKNMAAEAGMKAEELARDIVAQHTEPSSDDYTPAEVAAIEAGLAAIERGDVFSHEEVFAKLDARYRK